MKKKLISLFELILIVTSVFSFAYIISETNGVEGYRSSYEEGKGILYLREKLLSLLGRGLVSAQGGPVLWTCRVDINGTICQEYPSNVCNNNPPEGVCTEGCYPGPREGLGDCQIGTCFDPLTGFCSDGSPQLACTNSGGTWDNTGSFGICNRGCCLIGSGDQAQFTTERECGYIGETLGANTNWDGTITNEVQCLLLANSAAEGACVLEFLPAENAYNCEFTTSSNCDVSGGDFFEGSLCTSQNLVIQGNSIDTICETTLNGITQTSCSEDGDEVYFVDSCGNKANIYDSSKSGPGPYWDVVVSKENSCSLGNSVDPFSNQESCGNCDYLRGSLCGEQGVGDASPDLGSLVCRDLSCIDESGSTRINGESWCAFDGRIGLDGSGGASSSASTSAVCQNATAVAEDPLLQEWCNFESTTEASQGTNSERSVDTPGSRHYKKSCFDGEVRTEPCADFRNEVCVQDSGPNSGITAASCRINVWQQCFAANGDQDRLDKCEEHSDCFLKKVDIDEYFKFDMCAPKYPPGFELGNPTSSTVAENYCSFGSQTCTYIEEKGLGGWDCEVNCDCTDGGFAETMNNLCMSLGDCGTSVNFAGEMSKEGYRAIVRNENGGFIGRQELSSGYLSGLEQYAIPIPGQSAVGLSNEELAAIFGFDPATFDPSTLGSTIGQIGLGAIGVAYLYSITHGLSTAWLTGSSTATGSAALPLGAFGNAALGAAAGAGIAYLLGSIFGLAGEGLKIAVIAGAVVGAVVGVVIFGELGATFTSAQFFAALGSFLLWVGVIIIVIVIILSALGIGDTRERTVDFKCLPWQPPTGGDNCEECNSDVLSCSEYKCNSLGQNCEFINPGSGEELCVDVNPNDSVFPDIDVLEDAIGENYNYLNPQINVGTEIEFDGGDGCIKEYEPVEFGLELNEPGQCKFEEVHTGSYEEMTRYLGNPESNLYRYNHTTIMAMPTLDSLGVTGIDPGRRGDYDLYVRCQDSSGNWNPAEYNVRFCVKPADDLTAPIITEFNPESPGLASLATTSFGLGFYTNEPADCKWDLQDLDYENMENLASCNNGISQVTINGWLCQAVLPVTGNETEDYYFRCADQPWLGVKENGEIQDGRNKNTQSTPNTPSYQIQVTTTPLEINYVNPNGTSVIVGTEPVIVDLEIHTVGGIDNGNALCEFRTGSSGPFSGFLNTGGQVHEQNNLNLFEGSYNYPLQCIDAASNVATAEAIFDVEVDSTGPVITRYYQSGGTLNIVTNEVSQCAYSNVNCAFAFENGEQMSGSNYLHSTSFDPGLTYRVKCQDTFGNSGSCLSVSGGY